jgi:sugar O-acyltransferase (sialic acid O-acetyltransferase NeuD family)
MLIIGAKGFAKEILEVICQANPEAAPAFYDDVNPALPDRLFDRFPILRDEESARRHFETSGSGFTLGVGNPEIRFRLFEKFTALGGELAGTISPFARIGRFGNRIGAGANIMTGVVITADVIVGRGALINLNCTIGHDCTLGEFAELSPDVNISGHCKIGDFATIGTGAVVLPGVSVGRHAVIGAGSVVTKDIADHTVAYGIPARPIKKIGQ